MKDLKISYDNENGDKIEAQYDTIMDFIDLMNSNAFDVPMLAYRNVAAVFFENELNAKHFETITDLLEHCIAITR